MMQLTHSNGFKIKGNEKSHSSYFSKNPDTRGKKEVNQKIKKIKEREYEHLLKKGVYLSSKIDISIKTKTKIECSCRGENENCYKCDGSGLLDR